LDDLAAWEADEKLTLFPESPVRECKIHGGYGLAEYLQHKSHKGVKSRFLGKYLANPYPL
jgi:hypothetical protein